MAVSFSQIRQAISAYMNPLDAQGRETYRYWVRDVYPGGYAIVEDEQAKGNTVGRYLRVEYSVNDKDQVIIGATTKVKVEYVAVTESLRLSEAEAVGDTGLVWRVTLIRPGWSSNGFYYSPEVLGAAAALYEGVKAYANHPTETEMKDRPERSIQDVVGWYEGVRQESDGRLTGELHLLERAVWLGQDLKQKPDIYGLSHDVRGKTKIGEAAGRTGRVVEAIAQVKSTDVVTEAAAGGAVDQLIASNRPDSDPDSETRREAPDAMELKDLTLEALRAARPDLVQKLEEAARTAAKTEADQTITQLRESMQRSEQRSTAAETAVARITAKALVVERLAESNLPVPARVRVRTLIEAAALPMKDGGLDTETMGTKITEAIKAEQDYLTSVGGTGVHGAGAASANAETAMTEALKRADEALDAAFGVKVEKEGDK